MRDDFNFEKIVKKKTEGSLLLLKILLIFAYVIVAAIGFFLAIAFADGELMLIAFVIAMDIALIIFTWKYTFVEYEYSLMAKTLYIAKIYNNSARREIFESELSRAVRIAPYNEEFENEAISSKPDEVVKAVSSMDSDDVWFAIFELENNKKALVFFNVKTFFD